MMEMGQLVSSEVLPKVAAEFKRAAIEGGAYEKALKGLRVTEGQLITQSQRAGNTIFKSGFSEGLSELYKTIADLLKDSGPQLEKLGKIFGRVFKGIAHAIRILEPFLKAVIDNFEVLFGAAALSRVAAMSSAMGGLAAAMARAFLPLTAAVIAAEELASLMSDKLVGGIEKKMGKQINFLDKTVSDLKRDKEGNYLNGGNKEDFFGLGKFGEFFFMDNPFISAAKGGYNKLFSDPTTTTNNNGGNTYVFNNASADEMKRIIDYSGATSGMSASK